MVVATVQRFRRARPKPIMAADGWIAEL